MADDTAAQKNADLAVEALNDAVKALQTISDSDDDDDEEEDEEESGKSTVTQATKTGDHMDRLLVIWFAVLLAAAVGVGAVVVIKRKQNK